MRRLVLPLIWLVALVVTACAAVLPTVSRSGQMPGQDLGASHGVSLTGHAAVTAPFHAKAGARIPADIHHYSYELWKQTSNTLVATYVNTSSVAHFFQVPDGTYFLKANAFDTVGTCLVQGGASIASTGNATVATPAVTYSTGGALQVALPLADSTGGEAAVTVTAPYTSGYVARLVTSGTNLLQATYTSVAATFHFLQMPDGNYYAMVYATDGTGAATVVNTASPTTNTVSSLGRNVTAPFTCTITNTLGLTGGGAAADGIAATSGGMSPIDITIDTAGNIYFFDSTVTLVRMIPKTTGTYFGQAMTANSVYTIAGNGLKGTVSGDGGPASAAGFFGGGALAVDAAGNVYVMDGSKVRVIAAITGTIFGVAVTAGNIYTVAGGVGSFANGVAATAQALNSPVGIALDSIGNLFICDTNNIRIRMVAKVSTTYFGQVMTANNIYTVAGNGTTGFAGDGAVATGASLSAAASVALDSVGNLFICDNTNKRIRMVPPVSGTYFGQVMTANSIYTIAGTGTASFTGDNGLASSATINPNNYSNLWCDASGNVFLADQNNSRVRMIVSTGGTYFGTARTANFIYTVAGVGGGLFSGDNGLATSAHIANQVTQAIDGSGNLIIGDTGNGRIRVVAQTTGTYYGVAINAGNINTVAGNGSGNYFGDSGTATAAYMATAGGIFVDTNNNVIVAATGNNRVRVIAGATGTFYGTSMTAGKIYAIVGGTTNLGDASLTQFAGVSAPQGVAADATGNMYIADTGHHRIRLACYAAATMFGSARSANNIYTIAGNGTGATSVDGTAGASASVNSPRGVTLDSTGNVFIADTGNNLVRMVPAVGGTYFGIAMTAGAIYTIAGGGGSTGNGVSPTTALLAAPSGVMVDPQGNVFIADTGNNKVRMIPALTGTYFGIAMTAGAIYTVAGGGGGYADGGAATATTLSGPLGVCQFRGFLYIADTSNQRIRMVTPEGTIYLTAGSGAPGNTGDGSVAKAGQINLPGGIGLTPSGQLFFSSSDRIRRVN